MIEGLRVQGSTGVSGLGLPGLKDAEGRRGSLRSVRVQFKV